MTDLVSGWHQNSGGSECPRSNVYNRLCRSIGCRFLSIIHACVHKHRLPSNNYNAIIKFLLWISWVNISKLIRLLSTLSIKKMRDKNSLLAKCSVFTLHAYLIKYFSFIVDASFRVWYIKPVFESHRALKSTRTHGKLSVRNICCNATRMVNHLTTLVYFIT